MNEFIEEMQNGAILYHFPGVSVIVPAQNRQVVPVSKGTSALKSLPGPTKSFRLIRHIANICFVDANGNPVLSFEPPVEFRIGYTSFDVSACGGDFKKLRLAFWDGSDWIDISKINPDYMIFPPYTATVAEARIRNWPGDPPIAWGA
jgi:hypothetical protein